MRIAVITPYHGESPETLTRCIESVAAQSHPSTHILVGDGREQPVPGNTQHIRLPKAHGDYGDTPRLIGTISAYSQGFDGVCWLDGDCWLEPNHVERLLELANREVVPIVTATRNLRRPNGSLLGVCHESNGREFCDTNCYLVMREAIPTVAPLWGFKPQTEAVVGDRRVWNVAKTMATAHYSEPTVNYETKIAGHYLERGEQPPEDARVIVQVHGESHFRSLRYHDLVR